MGWLTNRYNRSTSKKYGWSPSWFEEGLSSFDSELESVIRKFQKEHDLAPDGKVGPMTYRRILAARELEEEGKIVNYILINGSKIYIDWDVKINLMPSKCYRTWRRERSPNMIVTHWDVTTSADKCKRVLENRKISTHFCIDNDGVIHQYVDANNVAWHAGRVNSRSIGIDFSNAYYLKYADYYVKKGFAKRPVCEDSIVHGVKLKPHLGYYNVQIGAYEKLLNLLCDHYDINMDVPRTKSGGLYTGVVEEAASGRYNGVVCHYHLTRGKIDCAGLKLDEIVDKLS
tara:strand:- start:712 stop:1569 length:858 start_codon:yes stop_codon:yes gene_type:complete